MVNDSAFETPPGPITVTLRVPTAAAASMVTVADTWVDVAVIPVIETLAEGESETAVTPARLAPLIVRWTDCPAAAALGLSDEICGAPARILNVRAFDVPPALPTVRLRVPAAALASMATVAVTCVAVAVMPETVIFAAGEKETAVTPARLFPAMVKVKVLPAAALLGLIVDIAGAGGIALGDQYVTICPEPVLERSRPASSPVAVKWTGRPSLLTNKVPLEVVADGAAAGIPART